MTAKIALPKDERQPRKVRLPGFITDEEIGLGDVIKRTTSYLGIQPCGGCERRAARSTACCFHRARKVTRISNSKEATHGPRNERTSSKPRHETRCGGHHAIPG